jgi:hypothetical protein
MKLLFIRDFELKKEHYTIDSTETNLDFILRENNTLDEVVITEP